MAARVGCDTCLWRGRAPDPDSAIEAERNLKLLRHVVEGLEAAQAPLGHVHMVHGCKWYGSQLGPYKTPAEEDDPRPSVPNFYYDQQDWAEARVRSGAAWSWSSLRPHLLTGFSLGYPHNSVGVLAAYASVRKARGEPLTFPGNQGAFDSVTQVTDLNLLVDAMVWCATDPKARNEAFNVLCADYYRWCDMWGEVAAFFEMEEGGVHTESLSKAGRCRDPLGRRRPAMA